MIVICPKCGYRQEQEAECLKCGIVFAKYAVRQEAATREWVPGEGGDEVRTPSLFRRLFRIGRWASLCASAVCLMLVLSPAAPPRVSSDPTARERTESKLKDLQVAARLGKPHTLRLDEAELNSWLKTNLNIQQPPAPTPSFDNPRPSPISSRNLVEEIVTEPEHSLEEVQSSVRDVRIDLRNDGVRAYVLFDLYGKEMSLLLEGRVVVRGGYLRLEPTAGKLGSLPIPSITLERAVSRLFDAPENKEKFRLPREVRDIRVEGEEFRIFYR